MSCQIETASVDTNSNDTDINTSSDYLNNSTQAPRLLANTTSGDSVNTLKCNLFDISKLSELRRVMYFPDMVVGDKYWIVHAPRGRFRTNWKQKITFLGFSQHEEDEEEKTIIFGECSIMEGNYMFMTRYELRDHAVFFCDE